MPRWIAALCLLGCLCASGSALARSDQGEFGAGPVGIIPVADPLAGDVAGVPKEQIVIVGAGIVAGALIVHLAVPGDLAYLAGGVVGGLAAQWWYQNGGEGKLRPLLKVNHAAAVVNARRGPVLDGIVLRR